MVFEFAHMGPDLAEFHRRVQLHLSHDELAIAQLADLAPWLHTFSIDAPSREHALLVKAILAAALTAKLAEVHLRLLLEDEVVAANAGVSFGLLAVGPVEEEDRVLITRIKLVLADAHLVLTPLEALQLRVDPSELVVQLHFMGKIFQEDISLVAIMLKILHRTFPSGLDHQGGTAATRRHRQSLGSLLEMHAFRQLVVSRHVVRCEELRVSRVVAYVASAILIVRLK
mmetsp:Transcript_22209/g.29719  ORF Transcript_22209/g.29719 Transcript_22209/m.29719 type:complete len:228 (-) Transcript_22209:31-714(-)